MSDTVPSHLPAFLQDAWRIRAGKRDELRALGFDPYENSSRLLLQQMMAADIRREFDALASGETSGKQRVAVGRIRAIRNSGLFVDIEDSSGRIQCFFQKTDCSERILAAVKLLDLGDIIAVAGDVRRTPRGEITINVSVLSVLAKALLPLPDKIHGLKDDETRRRKRHLDLLANEESRLILRRRSQIISIIRKSLDANGFLEVETPILTDKAGGAAAKPFTTHHEALDQDMVMRIAPELHLKRLLIGGLSDKLYEIGRNFRNEGVSTRHNPEFTSIEIYEANASDWEMKQLLPFLFVRIGTELGIDRISWGGHDFRISNSFLERSMLDLVADVTGARFHTLSDAEAVTEAARLGVELPEGTSWGHALTAVFEQKVESTLIQPIHVTGLPIDVSPLARRSKADPRLAERFETYICGMEIANGFSELTDPEEQIRRFRAQTGDEATEADDDFVEALAQGMAPAGGLGIGIDRLVMLFCGAESIRDVIAFPALRTGS